MPDLNPLAILATTLVLFVLSAAYYTVLGNQLARVSDAAAAAVGGDATPPWKPLVELLRSLILASVVAGLAVRGQIDELGGGLVLGLVLWLGFPLTLWMGALIWERTPLRLAVLHGGDWLVKLLVAGVILSVWQ